MGAEGMAGALRRAPQAQGRPLGPGHHCPQLGAVAREACLAALGSAVGGSSAWPTQVHTRREETAETEGWHQTKTQSCSPPHPTPPRGLLGISELRVWTVNHGTSRVALVVKEPTRQCRQHRR